MFRKALFQLVLVALGVFAWFTSSTTASDDWAIGDLTDVLVICPDRFQQSMTKWIEYRTKQGYSVGMVSPAPKSSGVKKQIRDVAANGRLKHVFLVGDSGDRNSKHRDLVPTDFIAAKVNVRFGSEPEIATDHTYVDFDDDGIQDLSIGP